LASDRFENGMLDAFRVSLAALDGGEAGRRGTR
jgi:hypothetical protein